MALASAGIAIKSSPRDSSPLSIATFMAEASAPIFTSPPDTPVTILLRFAKLERSKSTPDGSVEFVATLDATTHSISSGMFLILEIQ